MGFFRKPLSPEEMEQKKQYEEGKQRVLKLHQQAKTLFYIDDVTYENNNLVLIGEQGIGQLTPQSRYGIYTCLGVYVGDMTVDTVTEREERHFIPGRTMRTFCFPKEQRQDYLPGHILIELKEEY